MRHLRNVSISQFESFLEIVHCKFIKNDKGHCKYTRPDLNRPIIFQNHIDPIPEFIVKNNLRLFSYSKDDFFGLLDGVKTVERVSDKLYKIVKAKKS